MAGVITGRARSTGTMRLRLDQPHAITGVSSAGNTGGYVDPATIGGSARIPGPKLIAAQQERREAIEAQAKAAAKRASRHRNR